MSKAKPNPLMDAVWQATVAAIREMADAGISTVEIAAAAPDVMKAMGDAVLRKQHNLPYLLDGGAQVMGADHARRIIAGRATR